MFCIAQFAVLIPGILLANAWSMFLTHWQAFGRPAEHLLKIEGIYLGLYSVVVVLPYFLLWRTYQKALLSFVSAQDEVLVSGRAPGDNLGLCLLGWRWFS
jgi:hypothetical protein